MTYDDAFDAVVGVEGKYSNNPNDRGGETMYGITLNTARANGYTGSMSTMPLAVARIIYRRQYWDLLKLDDVNSSDGRIALELFDTAVNMGIGRATTFLQRSLNVLNHEGRDFPDLQVDGVMGPTTISALRNFLSIRGDHGVTVLLRALNALQGSKYIELAESDHTQEEFVYGWLLDRVAIE